jgi:hypothetical protein
MILSVPVGNTNGSRVLGISNTQGQKARKPKGESKNQTKNRWQKARKGMLGNY